MATTEMEEAEGPAKKSKMPLILGIVLALVLGGGAFYAVYSGMILGGGEKSAANGGAHGKSSSGGGHGGEPSLLDVAFVPIEPLVISVGKSEESRHLRFQAQLEVPNARQEEVVLLMPRVVDMLNSYLRAVEISEFEEPTALIHLRAQMLRRVQLVAGQDRVRDLLITEFVLN